MKWTRTHLLELEDLSPGEIKTILECASFFKNHIVEGREKTDILAKRSVLLLFFEPSTRTSTSFSIAAKRLGADVTSVAKATSSATKGETLSDTARNIEVMGIDTVVVRHSVAGTAHLLADTLKASVVNAGDGAHEHPTQGLLDIFTIIEKKGHVDGLTVAIVGDIAHSRVARSNIWGLTKLGARVIAVGPSTLVPREIENLGVEISYHLEDVLPECDVINMLRIQLERQAGNFLPSLREYSELFGLNARRLDFCREDVLVMHPGPMNRGIEITSDVAESTKSVILDQVQNGLAVRMAVLSLVSGVPVGKIHE